MHASKNCSLELLEIVFSTQIPERLFDDLMHKDPYMYYLHTNVLYMNFFWGGVNNPRS